MRMSRGALLVVVVVATTAAGALLAAACSTFGSDDPATPSTDASDEANGPNADDATAGGDGSADGGRVGVFCAQHPMAFICDDFDGVTLKTEWKKTTTHEATLGLSTMQAFSPSQSLFASLPEEANGTGDTNASLTFELLNVMSVTTVRSSFDVYLDALGQRSTSIGGVELADGTRVWAVYLLASDSSMTLYEDRDGVDAGVATTVPDRHAILPPIPMMSWARVIMEVDLGTLPTVTLTVQSPPGLHALPLFKVSILPTVKPTAMHFTAGLGYVQPQAGATRNPYRVFVDNVVFEP